MENSNNNLFWKTKLGAWVHDPAEKALILLRDATGHEWGTVAGLREQLFGSRSKPSDTQEFIERADWYAAAADRPNFPKKGSDHRYANWMQVDFAKNPVLKHPLTGEEHTLQPLEDIPLEILKMLSKEHFETLIHHDEEGRPDWRRTQLAYWRFGPSTPRYKDDGLNLNHLWQNLPADTRVPDHTIWSHLDTVSAFAGAMALDKDHTVGLLTVSFGPVQGFISEARSTSDLWAGSHFLACIAWEGMKVIAEKLGPDAIVFPALRGVPLVDVWLRDAMNLDEGLFEDVEVFKNRQYSDTNDLFTAALPNRFVAIVPADHAQDLAQQITQKVREFVFSTGKIALDKLLEIVGEKPEGQHCYTQLKEQLDGFPEIHWATVPWSLAEGKAQKSRVPADDKRLRVALRGFYPEGEEIGFLDTHSWKLLSNDLSVDGVRFYKPNPGILYPAIYDLLDRLASAAKTTRQFSQLRQEGYRSTLNGEREWLTLDEHELQLPPGKRDKTLWARLAKERPALAKEGEHLDALAMIKRFWPVIFSEQAGNILKVDSALRRYVVSTHMLAMSVSLEKWMKKISEPLPDWFRDELKMEDENAALPHRLVRSMHSVSDERKNDVELVCRKLPVLYEKIEEREKRKLEKQLSLRKVEAYYGVLLFDGDHMGAWVSGDEDTLTEFQESWHPEIRNSVQGRFSENPDIEMYLNEKRPLSPARHRSISEALNGFSLRLVRFVVEDCYKGKLIYAGGDDVMAFLCVDDLLPAMTLLNALYSGRDDAEDIVPDSKSLNSGKGYVRLRGHLLPVMGSKATASCGAVIAHHQTPLGMVMRELRAAEQRAKKEGKRDSFSLKILKRAGGAIGMTGKWYQGKDGNGNMSVPCLIQRLISVLSRDTSRRAAYHSTFWLRQLPAQPDSEMLKAALSHQFSRQTRDCHDADHRELIGNLVDLAKNSSPDNYGKYLEDMLMVAEFLARESRERDVIENGGVIS